MAFDVLAGQAGRFGRANDLASLYRVAISQNGTVLAADPIRGTLQTGVAVIAEFKPLSPIVLAI